MTTQTEQIFSHVRSKLRHSRSSVILPTSTPAPPELTPWENVPMAFGPVERTDVRVVNGYYLNRPLPGPPPRPRTTSPTPPFGSTSRLEMGNLRNPTPRTHRRRSAQEAQTRWSSYSHQDLEAQAKQTSCEIAVALPPSYLDPPPPYSRYPHPPAGGYQADSRVQVPAEATFQTPYNPMDYVDLPARAPQQLDDQVPVIAAPQPPTPVSPLNTLDIQFLASRRRDDDGNVTVENLLDHPMLRHSH